MVPAVACSCDDWRALPGVQSLERSAGELVAVGGEPLSGLFWITAGSVEVPASRSPALAPNAPAAPGGSYGAASESVLAGRVSTAVGATPAPLICDQVAGAEALFCHEWRDSFPVTLVAGSEGAKLLLLTFADLECALLQQPVLLGRLMHICGQQLARRGMIASA